MAREKWLILSPTNIEASKREKSLKLATAKSHVASINHMKRRRRMQEASNRKSGQDQKTAQHELLNPGCHAPRALSPRAIVDNARKEPFQACALELTHREQELVDTHINQKFYGRRLTPTAFNWFKDVVFVEAIRHPVVFRCGVLGVAAIMQGRFQVNQDTLSQDVQSLTLIRRHFAKSPNDCSDESIMICIFRSVFDDFQGKVAASLLHAHAAVQMIRRRGGPESFRNNQLITILANCYDYRSRGYMEGSMLAHMSYPITRDLPSDVDRTDAHEIATAREEFIHFLYSVEQLSYRQKDIWELQRHCFFRPGTVVQRALSAPYDVVGSFPSLQHHATFGMSVLLHFNAALWDFRNDRGLSETFFQDLCDSLEEAQLHLSCSLESLAHFLLWPTRHHLLRDAQFERLWKVGRLSKIAKRLSATNWHRLWANLEAYLTFNDPEISVIEWDSELREEIDNAPPTKLRMALLQESGQKEEEIYVESCY